MSPGLELLAAVLVFVDGAEYGHDLALRGKRYGTGYPGARALRSLGYFLSRRVCQRVIVASDLDSDDLLPDNAVERILKAWSRVSADDRYAGIIAYKGESEDRPIYGNVFPKTDDCSFRELYRKGFKGETTLVLRTDLLKAHPFPEIEGEKYVPEDVVYDRIDEGHIFMILPEILTVCELVEAGYTDRVEELRCEAPTGWFIYYYQRALSWPPSLMKLKFASHYLRFRKRADKKYAEDLRLPLHLVLAGLPGCALLALRGKL